MNIRLSVVAAALVAGATLTPGSRVNAQSPDARCVNGGVVGADGCQKALDIFRYVAPQLGTLVAGGNAVLGGGGPLGGLMHFYVGVRANVLNADLPDVSSAPPSVGGVQQSTYSTKGQFVALPQADVAIGIFKGIPLAITNVGGVDLLASVAYIPSFDGSSVHVDGGKTQIGLGARLGLLQESIILPGVSLTVLRRDLPTVNLTASSGGDSLFVNNLKVKTTSWRLVANKSLILFGLAAGVGQDRYSSNADLGAYISSVSTNKIGRAHV